MLNKEHIGLDIGKTKIACAVVNASGKLIALSTEKTDQRGGEHLIQQCFGIVEKTIKKGKAKPQGIGIGTSGIVRNDGYVDSEADGWLRLPVKTLFEKKFHTRVLVDNDVRTAALGEHLFGASRGFDTSAFIIIGTGMGVGIVKDGRVLRGKHGLAGQIGRLNLIGNSDRRIEHLFSGGGLEKRAREELGRNASSDEIFESARKGDADMKKLVREAEKAAGSTIAWIQNTIDPDIIVLGGSVAMNQKDFVAEAKKNAEKELKIYLEAAGLSNLNIVRSKLGGNAGVLGAAGMLMIG